MQSPSLVLGQLFLLVCLAAMLAVAGILLILFGPLPVRRRVAIVPRLGAAPLPVAPFAVAPSFAAASLPAVGSSASLVSQLARGGSDEFFTPPRPVQVVAHEEPIPVTAAQVPSLRKPKGGKVQPLPKKRAAKGTESPAPFAPVVRSAQRQLRDEEDMATSPVPTFDTSELTIVDR